MAEEYYNFSPYNYVENNPLFFIDPNGEFSTRFGAWWYKVWNGGDEIGKDTKTGEYYVSSDKPLEGDGCGVQSTLVFYKNGRNEGIKTNDNKSGIGKFFNDLFKGGIPSYGSGGDSGRKVSNPDKEAVDNSWIDGNNSDESSKNSQKSKSRNNDSKSTDAKTDAKKSLNEDSITIYVSKMKYMSPWNKRELTGKTYKLRIHRKDSARLTKKYKNTIFPYGSNLDYK